MKCCINGGNVIRLLSLSAKLLKFEIQKCGQILCAHKPYFLMPGHICNLPITVLLGAYIHACDTYLPIFNLPNDFYIILLNITLAKILSNS